MTYDHWKTTEPDPFASDEIDERGEIRAANKIIADQNRLIATLYLALKPIAALGNGQDYDRARKALADTENWRG